MTMSCFWSNQSWHHPSFQCPLHLIGLERIRIKNVIRGQLHHNIVLHFVQSVMAARGLMNHVIIPLFLFVKCCFITHTFPFLSKDKIKQSVQNPAFSMKVLEQQQQLLHDNQTKEHFHSINGPNH